MSKIIRDPRGAATGSFGLIIVGGGIYGSMIALSAARQGISALILEQNDFASGTTFNSLKTIHGGLRYLQDLNLGLYFQYVRERRWFLRTVPHMVRPLPVLLPIYNRGLNRRTLIRAALQLDKTLSASRNQGLDEKQQLPSGRIINRMETIDLFPGVDQKGLRGAACWYDAFMPDPQLLLISILKQACALGSTALNYCQVNRLLVDEHRVTGVTALDHVSGRHFDFQAPVVINATGPWVREMSGLFDAEYADLYKYSMAWNVLFRTTAWSSHALAIKPRKIGSQTYFAHNWNNRLLIGTGHAPRKEFSADMQPTETELQEFLNAINQAVPGANLSSADIDHVYTGFLPVKKEGKTRLKRVSRFLDHTRYGGPSGLYSITGVKYSEARHLAENLVDRLFPGTGKLSAAELTFSDRVAHRFSGDAFFKDPAGDIQQHADILRSVIQNEAVIHLDDLILRRTNIGDDPAIALSAAPHIADLFSWDENRKKEELQRLRRHYRYHTNQ